MKMTMLIIIPGFGSPHENEKTTIIKKNIKLLERYDPIEIWIFQYNLFHMSFFDHPNVKVFKREGHIGHAIFSCKPSYLKRFKYIGILLDDVELCDHFDIHDYVRMLDESKCDIIQPAYHPSKNYTSFPHQYLRNPHNAEYRKTNFLELFFYLMTSDAYRRYHQLILPRTKYMWGIDYILFHKGFSLAITDKYHFLHHFVGNNDDMNKKMDELNTMFNTHVHLSRNELW